MLATVRLKCDIFPQGGKGGFALGFLCARNGSHLVPSHIGAHPSQAVQPQREGGVVELPPCLEVCLQWFRLLLHHFNGQLHLKGGSLFSS